LVVRCSFRQRTTGDLEKPGATMQQFNRGELGRRPFLAATAAIFGSWSVPQSFSALLSAEPSRGRSRLEAVKDETTGLALLQLPTGFRYASFGWTGDPLIDGTPTPGAHDGMAVIAEQDGLLTLCRNHELALSGTPFSTGRIVYDRLATGGCTNLEFDTNRGLWKRAWSSLAGTLKNCAGGPTPWGTWLSCEETVVQNGDLDGGKKLELEHAHGYVFEVPAQGAVDPRPLKDMGRFVHEAVAVDPRNGIVYETEDRAEAGFYRFVPHKFGDISAGGRLEMLALHDHADLVKGAKLGFEYDVRWVPIEQPELAHSPGTQDGGGVFAQGRSKGGATFARLEGCWWGNGVCYFDSTNGGRAGAGQIWQYDPRAAKLRLIFESPSREVLDSPDNLAVSPRGGIVLCEDGTSVPQRLHALTPDGVLSELARNHVVLNGERNQLSGDFRSMEWAGASFSSDGRWLFVNLQTPGITFAITGPWESIGL
jgi:secreted PhoX family phosphatase